MQFILKIQCDGEAFEDYPAEEVAAILTRLMDKAPGYSHRNLATADPGDRTEDDPFILLDRNGQRVGTAYFDFEEDVRGCSCGMADYGAPGHDGDPNGHDNTTEL